MGLGHKIYEKLLLRAHRHKQYDSVALRDHFLRAYGIRVGLHSYGCFDRWRIPPGSTIGRYCSFANTVRILDANHPIDALSTHPYFYEQAHGIVDTDRAQKTHIVIEDGVWLSHNVTITPSVSKIGRGAIVGAGAVVTKNVPPYAIVAGAPGRVLRYRFDERTILAVEDSRWWDLDKTALRNLVRERPDFAFAPNLPVNSAAHG
jgi:acetyltransferase-like isoleucine patch superfamily enzyme